MQENNLIERGLVDIDAEPATATGVTHLTDASAPVWSGVVDISARGAYDLDAAARHDVYVLRGDASIDGQPLSIGDYVVTSGSARINAGDAGARLLLYRETSGAQPEREIHSAAERQWLDGRNPLMRVVPLSHIGHGLSLVAWTPGARTRDHAHPNGEEIFVLSGELRSENERYPAGTWLRLHRDARHSPFAEVPTVIMLRHGHLAATAGAVK